MGDRSHPGLPGRFRSPGRAAECSAPPPRRAPRGLPGLHLGATPRPTGQCAARRWTACPCSLDPVRECPRSLPPPTTQRSPALCWATLEFWGLVWAPLEEQMPFPQPDDFVNKLMLCQPSSGVGVPSQATPQLTLPSAFPGAHLLLRTRLPILKSPPHVWVRTALPGNCRPVAPAHPTSHPGLPSRPVPPSTGCEGDLGPVSGPWSRCPGACLSELGQPKLPPGRSCGTGTCGPIVCLGTNHP